MAKLEGARKAAWQEALYRTAAPWIACGLDSTLPTLAERVRGMAALIDWRIHGQVSKLLSAGALPVDEFCLVPLPSGQNFLFYHYAGRPDPAALGRRLQQLGVRELALAASTFPKDFLSKVEQNLKVAGISSRRLEPDV